MAIMTWNLIRRLQLICNGQVIFLFIDGAAIHQMHSVTKSINYKFNKIKCKMLHLGRGKPWCQDRLEGEWTESSPARKESREWIKVLDHLPYETRLRVGVVQPDKEKGQG